MIHLTVIDYTHALDNDEFIDYFLTKRHLSASEVAHVKEIAINELRKNPDSDRDEWNELIVMYLQALGIHVPYVFSEVVKLPMV